MTGPGPESWPTRRKPIRRINRNRFRLTADSPQRDRVRAELEARELAAREAERIRRSGRDVATVRGAGDP